MPKSNLSLCIGVLALVAACLCPLTKFAAAGTVAQARGLPLSSNASIDGLTLTRVVDFTQSSGNHVIYGQDATGGMGIIASTANMASFLAGLDGISGNSDDAVPGSRIDISGATGSFNGFFQLGEIPFAQIWTYQGFSGLPSVVDMDITEMQDGSLSAELNEGMLVQLKGVSFVQSGLFSGSSNYTVTDGTQNAIVRVNTSAMTIVGTPIPDGVVDLVGILGQFDTTDPRDGGYQVLVSFPSDIIPVPEPSVLTLLTLAAIGLLGMGWRRRKWA